MRRAMIRPVAGAFVAMLPVLLEVLCANPAVAAASPPAVDWPQYRADAAHTGAVAGQPGLGALPVGLRGLREVAAVSVGLGTAPPSVAGGVAYEPAGDLDAFDAASGASRWVWPPAMYHGIFTTTLPVAAVNGGLFVSAFDTTGRLWSLDPVTTDARWEDPPIPDGPSPNRGDVPVVADGVVYQIWDVSGVHRFPGPEVMTVRADDAATGTLRWQTYLPRDIYGTTPSTGLVATPAVSGGRIVVASMQYTFAPDPNSNGEITTFHSQLAAYSTADGSQLWSVVTSPDGTASTTSPTVSVPTVAISGDTAYGVAADGSVGAYDLNTGARRWRRAVGAALTAAPAVANGRVLVATADGHLDVLDAGSGAVVRRVSVGTGPVSSPAVAGDLAWVTDGASLVAVQPLLGAVVRRVPLTGASTAGEPVIAADRVLVTTSAAGGTSTVHLFAPR